MISIPTPVKKHSSVLDGIRGLAILLVLLYHVYYDLGATRIGWIGVDLFFVLSGFLITGILIDTKEKPGYYKNFLIRRSLRIFPLYYFFLALIFIIVPLCFPHFLLDFAYYNEKQIWYWTYLQNWLYSFEGFPANYYLHHLWSLAIEEQFYVIWPFVVLLFSRKKLVYISLFLILAASLFRAYGGKLGMVFPYGYVNTFARMDALLLGGLVAILQRLNPRVLAKTTIPVFVASGFFIIIFIILQRSVYFGKLQPVFLLVGLFFAAMLTWAMSGSYLIGRLFQRFFSLPIMNWLGKYSYGLYIYHYPIYLSMVAYCLPFFVKNVHNELLAKVINGSCSILLTVVLSLLSYSLLEKPFLSLKDRLTPKKQ